MTKEELLKAIQTSWDEFNAYLDTLSEEQLTQPADAAGWTVKDHLSHVTMWEEGMVAMLLKQPRGPAMGLQADEWANFDSDQINAVIQEQHKGDSLGEVKRMSKEVHQRLVEHIQQLSDGDLQRPYREFQADSDDGEPIIGRLQGNTFEHYEEHRPWIEAIVKR
jgi:uncharacterized protein (TIGR03083 family)